MSSPLSQEPPPASAACEAVLRSVAEGARLRLPMCATAGVTVMGERAPVLVVGTSLLGRQLEEAQWAAGQGPGLDAVRQLQVFNVQLRDAAAAWPDFARFALNRGVLGALAIPITAGGQALGVLTLYAVRSGAFDGCEAVGLECAAAAAAALDGGPWASGGDDRPHPPVGDLPTGRVAG